MLGSYHFGTLAIHGTGILRWATFWGAFFILVGLYEEFAFRGYVQFTLAQAVRFWPAAIVLSVAFVVVLILFPVFPRLHPPQPSGLAPQAPNQIPVGQNE